MKGMEGRRIGKRQKLVYNRNPTTLLVYHMVTFEDGMATEKSQVEGTGPVSFSY